MVRARKAALLPLACLPVVLPLFFSAALAKESGAAAQSGRYPSSERGLDEDDRPSWAREHIENLERRVEEGGTNVRKEGAEKERDERVVHDESEHGVHEEHDKGAVHVESEHGVHEEHGKGAVHGEGEHGAHEEEPGTPSSRAANIAVAMCMLAGIAFTMGIFYLVNHPDLDMKMYAWEVVSCTISIFAAVLLFHLMLAYMHDFDFSLESFFPKEVTLIHVTTNIFLFLVCYISIHLVIRGMAVQIVTKPEHKKEPHHGKKEEYMPLPLQGSGTVHANGHAGHKAEFEIPENSRLMLICWSTLWAHMSSFAAIHAGGSIQHYLLSKTGTIDDPYLGPVVCTFAILPTLGMLFGCFRLADVYRTHTLRAAGMKERGQSQHSDQHHDHHHHMPSEMILEIWDEAAEDAEDDVGSLALSFLLCQSVRFAIIGILAGPEGRVSDEICPSGAQVFLLFLVAAASVGLRVGMMLMNPSAGAEREASDDTSWAEYCRRWIFISGSIFAQHFAWCLLYVIVWSTRRVLDLFNSYQMGYGINSPCIRSVLTMLVSISAFFTIWLFDLMSDMAKDQQVETALRSIIKSLGVLVGFSWEQAFAAGLEDIVVAIEPAELHKHAHHGDHEFSWVMLTVKTTMAVVLSIIVVPAWRMYILKSVLSSREACEVHAKQRSVEKGRTLELRSAA